MTARRGRRPYLVHLLGRFARSRSGATAVEYAILISMVTLMIAGFVALSQPVGSSFNKVAGDVEASVGPLTTP